MKLSEKNKEKFKTILITLGLKFVHYLQDTLKNKWNKSKNEKDEERFTEVVKWKFSPNFSSRTNSEIDAIIIHHTGPGGIKAAISWCESKKSKVSYHYLIDRDGNIYQMVKDENKAWHVGVSLLGTQKNVNKFSIGIALEGEGKEEFTEKQYQEVAFLCKVLKRRYSKITDERIVGHKDVAPGRKIDPCPWDDEKFRKLLKN